MRLGAYPCKIEKGTLAYQAYGKEEISNDIVTVMNSTINIRNH